MKLESRRILITGGAGVIGSEMARKLITANDISIIDNLSSGCRENLDGLKGQGRLEFHHEDITSAPQVDKVMKDIDVVFHFAANGDIRFREGAPTDLDLRSNTIGTYNVLESMRREDVADIVFSSSSAIYGEPDIVPTPENYGPLMPASLYGASKLAGEGLLSAFAGTYGIRAWIYRFANVVGNKSRKIGKNVIPDFIAKLTKNPLELEILGDGRQTKSYLYIDDCIDGMLELMQKREGKVSIHNLGSVDTVTVKEIADIVTDEMGLKNVKYSYTGGRGGWKGDIPLMFLDTAKATRDGWTAKKTSAGAVRQSARDLIRQIKTGNSK